MKFALVLISVFAATPTLAQTYDQHYYDANARNRYLDQQYEMDRMRQRQIEDQHNYEMQRMRDRYYQD